MSASACQICLTREARPSLSTCAVCQVPRVKYWGDMTVDEQVDHLFHTHGYQGDYFEHYNGTNWTDSEALDYFRGDEDVRDEYHDQDHREYELSGGKEHRHLEVSAQAEREAITSIKEAIRARARA